jgi:glucokinase
MVSAPPNRRTATTKVVTEINRTAVLDVLRGHGPLTRKEIGERTGLSPSTVERLTGALLGEGLIERGGLARSSGGRPSGLLRYSGGAQVVAVAEVTAAGSRGKLLGFDGEWANGLTSALAEPDGLDAPSRRLDGLLEMIDDLVAAAGRAGQTCVGVAVVVPGVVHEGIVKTTGGLGWRDTPLESIVAERTQLPVVVENDANAIVLGEWARGTVGDASTAASFVLGVGAGAGIVHDGKLYRGARSAAGEVGFLFADVDALRNYYTDRGDLESRIGNLARRIVPGAPTVDEAIAGAMDACADGTADPELAAAFFDLLAFTLGAIATMFDTEIVVFAGHLLRAPELVTAEIGRRLVGRIPAPPLLVPASLGEDSALTGAGELIIGHVRGATYLA